MDILTNLLNYSMSQNVNKVLARGHKENHRRPMSTTRKIIYRKTIRNMRMIIQETCTKIKAISVRCEQSYNRTKTGLEGETIIIANN